MVLGTPCGRLGSSLLGSLSVRFGAGFLGRRLGNLFYLLLDAVQQLRRTLCYLAACFILQHGFLQFSSSGTGLLPASSPDAIDAWASRPSIGLRFAPDKGERLAHAHIADIDAGDD